MNEALKSKRYSVLCDLISEIKPEKGKCKWERSNVTGKTVEYYYTKYCGKNRKYTVTVFPDSKTLMAYSIDQEIKLQFGETPSERAEIRELADMIKLFITSNDDGIQFSQLNVLSEDL